MMRLRTYIIPLIFISFINTLSGMTEDSRERPEYPRNFSKTWCRPSAAFVDFFINTGNQSFDSNGGESDVSLYSVFGPYYENKLVDAVVLLGQPNPFDLFPTLQRFRDQEILWNMDGKIQEQGVIFQLEQHIWGNLWVGGSFFFMHSYVRNNFSLNFETIQKLLISPEDALNLDRMRRMLNDQVGLRAPVESRTGFSDIDLYIGLGDIQEYLYCWKTTLKRVEGLLKFGTMIPTSKVRNVENPASVPFGGDGHWGVYSSLVGEIELKEDWKIGGHFRVNKRFAKTKQERLVIAGEQQLYGAVQGPVRINPGVTFIAAPYVRLECIREGFGLQVGYTISAHLKDSWSDQRQFQTPPAMLQDIEKNSSWIAEYVTVDAFFDVSKIYFCNTIPLVSLRWDIPIKVFAAKGAFKTNRVSIGLAYNF